MELATLQGSVKQINWAKGIRKNRLQVWQREDAKRFQAVGSMLGQQELASWWIANKEKTLEEVCEVLHGGTTATPIAPNPVTSVAAVPKTDSGRRAAADEDGVSRVVTDTGFIQVGPTRNIVTGEVVVDHSLPF